MPNTKIPLISREDLKAKLDRGDDFTLVEALPPPNYREGHLPRAINLPPIQVTELAPKRLPDRDAEIVVYCASPTCHAADNATRELVALGYTNVKEFAGGKEEWRDAEFPLER